MCAYILYFHLSCTCTDFLASNVLPFPQFDVRYEMKQRKLCNTHTVYTTERPIFTTNWGWYYGASIPPVVRVPVDRAITTLRLEDNLRQLISNRGELPNNLDCGKPNRSIGAEIIGPMISLVVIVFGPVLCAALVRVCIVRRRAKRGYKVQ